LSPDQSRGRLQQKGVEPCWDPMVVACSGFCHVSERLTNPSLGLRVCKPAQVGLGFPSLEDVLTLTPQHARSHHHRLRETTRPASSGKIPSPYPGFPPTFRGLATIIFCEWDADRADDCRQGQMSCGGRDKSRRSLRWALMGSWSGMSPWPLGPIIPSHPSRSRRCL